MSDPRTQTPDEFANVPSPRARHPILALLGVFLAVYLVWHVRDDVLYALSSGTPVDLGDARALAGKKLDTLPLNRYVRLSGKPDRESAVVLDVKGSWHFGQFFRLLGTGNRVFVSRVADPVPVQLAERDVFVGRLVPVKGLSFHEAIRKHFSVRVTATHLFSAKAIAAALSRGGAPLVVRDLLGDPVTLSPGDELTIEAVRPGEIRIELPRERFPDAAAARAAVTTGGGEVLSVSADGGATPAQRWVVIARFAATDRDRALSAIGDLDRRVRIRPARQTTTARVSDLTAASDGMALKGVALTGVQSVRMMSSVEIPEDAVLLREGDRPRNHVKHTVVVAFLIAFAVFNLTMLRRPR